MVAYEMTTNEHSLLVVLNRGGANQLQTTYDEIIYGTSSLSETTLSIPADSVTILAHSGNSSAENQNNTGNETTNDGDNSTNSTIDDSNNTTEVDNNQSEEMKTCEGCCGETSEVPVSEPCPVVACAPCDEVEDSNDSASSSTATIFRNLLLIVVIVVLVVFIQMNRRSEDNH